METAKNFSSIALHKTRELMAKTVRNKIEVILQKKRFDEFWEMSEFFSSQVTLNMDIFQQIFHLIEQKSSDRWEGAMRTNTLFFHDKQPKTRAFKRCNVHHSDLEKGA